MTTAQAQATRQQHCWRQPADRGLLTRTTEYRIDRWGVTSNLLIDLGDHRIELGGWFERNSATQWRRW